MTFSLISEVNTKNSVKYQDVAIAVRGGYTERVGQVVPGPARPRPVASTSLPEHTTRPAHQSTYRATRLNDQVGNTNTIHHQQYTSALVMQVLATLLMATVLGVVRGVIRTPLEAFRPSGEIHLKRPDKLPLLPHRRTAMQAKSGLKILYQIGMSEEDLPECRARQVCSKADLYDAAQPWIERKCRCLGHKPCSSELSADDNHTLSDKTTLYKTCEPIKRLPKCRYFKDAAWTIYSFPDTNATQQIVNCHCPKASMTYLLKKLSYTTASGELGNQYQFACSPLSRLRCSRKEPCKLFSVRRRHEQIDEVNASTICQCPREHTCPRHHTEPGVLPGVTYAAEDIRTYHGYCLPEPTLDTYRFVGDKD